MINIVVRIGGKLAVFNLLWADDIFYAGNQQFEELALKTTSQGITLDQIDYVKDKLEPAILRGGDNSRPLHCTTSGWELAAAAVCWPTCSDTQSVHLCSDKGGCANKSLGTSGWACGPGERVLQSGIYWRQGRMCLHVLGISGCACGPGKGLSGQR